MVPRASTSVRVSHNERPLSNNRSARLTFCVAGNAGWGWRVACMSSWCATFALQFTFARSSLQSYWFVSRANAFHVGVGLEPGPAIYGLWLLHKITQSDNAHVMTAVLNKVWSEHSKTNPGLDYIPWRCWTLYSLSMCIARKFIQDGSIRGWSSWIELDNTLFRQLEISVLQSFPLWVPRVVEGGHGWIRYPNYWQLELAEIHRKAELLEAYVTPDEHSVALGAFEEAFESIRSEPLVDGWDTDFLGTSEPHCSSHYSPSSEQSLSPFGSPSTSVEDSDSDARVPPPGHIDFFKIPLTSLPSSGFVPTPYENHIFFGSPEMDDEYRGLAHSHYSPALTDSPKSTLGVWDVPGFYKPPSTIHLTESGLSRQDPIFISNFPVQSMPPTIIFGSPPPHSFTSWSSSISRTAPGITLRSYDYSHVPELNRNGGTMDISNPYFNHYVTTNLGLRMGNYDKALSKSIFLDGKFCLRRKWS